MNAKSNEDKKRCYAKEELESERNIEKRRLERLEDSALNPETIDRLTAEDRRAEYIKRYCGRPKSSDMRTAMEGYLEYVHVYIETHFNCQVQETAGAKALLQKMHALGKKVYLIYRGGVEFQDSIAARLDLKDFTTDQIWLNIPLDLRAINGICRDVGVEKTDIGVIGSDIGDDIKGAVENGILAVLFHEKGRCGLTDGAGNGGWISVNSLAKLEDAFG